MGFFSKLFGKKKCDETKTDCDCGCCDKKDDACCEDAADDVVAETESADAETEKEEE